MTDDDLPPGDRWLTLADVTPHWQAGQLAKALREFQHATYIVRGWDGAGWHEGPRNMMFVSTVRQYAVDCLSTLGESGESGEKLASARVPSGRRAGEDVANLPARYGYAVRLVGACDAALAAGRIADDCLDEMIHCLYGMDADRDLGSQTKRIRAAAGRKGTAKRRRASADLTADIERLAARLRETEDPHKLASTIADQLGVHPATVRKRLKRART